MAQRCTYCGRTQKQHGGKACVDVAGFRQVLGKPKPVEVRIQLDHSDVGHIYVSQDRFALEARSEQIVLTHRQIQEIVDYAREHGAVIR